jgi:hypothetical protein
MAAGSVRRARVRVHSHIFQAVTSRGEGKVISQDTSDTGSEQLRTRCPRRQEAHGPESSSCLCRPPSVACAVSQAHGRCDVQHVGRWQQPWRLQCRCGAAEGITPTTLPATSYQPWHTAGEICDRISTLLHFSGSPKPLGRAVNVRVTRCRLCTPAARITQIISPLPIHNEAQWHHG